MKRVLVDAYLALNFGDDLFLKILFEKYKDVEWILINGSKEYREVFKAYSNVKFKNNIFYKILNKVRLLDNPNFIFNYDAMIYIGGSIFMQYDNWKNDYNIRLRRINKFRKKDKPVYIIGSNFGPYTDNDFIEKYRDLFRKCTDICFRDKYSYNMFSELKNVRLAPDIVFQLKVNNTKKIKDSLGISVIDLNNRSDLLKYKELYKEKLIKIINNSIKLGKRVYLFSFCEEQGDLNTIKEIIENIESANRSKIECISYNGNIDEFTNIFSKMENIIGTRFHACILSQVFSQGLYPIIYSDKTYNVLSDLNLNKEYCYIKDLKDINENEILKRIDRNKIYDRSVLKLSEEQFNALDEYLK